MKLASLSAKILEQISVCEFPYCSGRQGYCIREYGQSYRKAKDSSQRGAARPSCGSEVLAGQK
jgi:hypothetical protein